MEFVNWILIVVAGVYVIDLLKDLKLILSILEKEREQCQKK
jgi:hypothetical protein